MTTAVRRPADLRVLVDEAHQQAWTIRPDLAATMAPAHPHDSSLAKAAALLTAREFAVDAHTSGQLTAEVLARVDVLVLPHASDSKFEATTGIGSPMYDDLEIAAIRSFVENGGGLVVLGESEQDKYGSNLATIASQFGITLRHNTVQDYTGHHKVPSWVRAEPAAQHQLLSLVQETVFYRAGTLDVDGNARVVLRSSATAAPAAAPLLAAAEAGAGRVVVAADSDLFGDDCIDAFDHTTLWLNIVYWTALPSFRHTRTSNSEATGDPHWIALRSTVDELRLLQNADGSIDLEQTGQDLVASLVERTASDVEALQPHFAHQDEYLRQVVRDLRSWLDGGCQKPDFGASLALFRPELQRSDDIEHLVVFPMYTPNGSLDTRFEALVVRVPWPGWIAELEARTFDNGKFVPVHLVDNTAGYDSECAVLFPETVSVVGKAANTFGGIFCDREAARYQRVVSAAIQATQLNVPPSVSALLASESMTQDMFELWDLIHDRAHSHGELPFDPFMIRQRLPFWMYSLEELRCDLTAFHQAGELVGELPFAEYVRYGVLFDRIFRFPLTGSRVRNYDGLAGQLLFGFLHSRGVATWRDNVLELDWERLPAEVDELRREIESLYRAGISASKVRYWIAAHDLISKYVQPTLGSQWTPEARDGRDEADPKSWVELVNPDEFPLSMFYQSMAGKLAPAIEGAAA